MPAGAQSLFDAAQFVQARFSAVLVWERNPSGSGAFELNPRRSSTSHLAFLEYAHSSSGYTFVVGVGLIGRAASLPIGGMLRLRLKDTTTADFHRKSGGQCRRSNVHLGVPLEGGRCDRVCIFGRARPVPQLRP